MSETRTITVGQGIGDSLAQAQKVADALRQDGKVVTVGDEYENVTTTKYGLRSVDIIIDDAPAAEEPTATVEETPVQESTPTPEPMTETTTETTSEATVAATETPNITTSDATTINVGSSTEVVEPTPEQQAEADTAEEADEAEPVFDPSTDDPDSPDMETQS